MTTRISIANHGPGTVTVKAVSVETVRKDGKDVETALPRTLKSGEFVDQYYAHSGQRVVVEEILNDLGK